MTTGRYDVRGDARSVAERALHVRIDDDAISRWAQSTDPAAIRPIERPAELTFSGPPEETARWILLLDALNFCFWSPAGTTPWQVEHAGRRWHRYYALVACLHRAVAADRTWLEPQRWAAVTAEQVAELFAGQGRIPMLADRVRIMRETGRVTLERYDSRCMAILERAEFDAVQIACDLADAFSSFRDIHDYNGSNVAILKRAQIFAADIAVAMPQVDGPSLGHLSNLTAFADYRLPQVLRHLDVLRLAPAFEADIENGKHIAPSSEREIELRVCTIEAVERMVSSLRNRRGADVPAWMLDEYLWERSHDPDVRLKHHLTLTWFY